MRPLTFDEQMRIAAAKAQGWTEPFRFGNVHLHATPPDADEPCKPGNAQHVPEELDALVHQLCKRIQALSFGIQQVRELMDDSDGVAGLHLNGDVAQWGELQDGGKFWEWLWGFNCAEEVIPPNLEQEPEDVDWDEA